MAKQFAILIIVVVVGLFAYEIARDVGDSATEERSEKQSLQEKPSEDSFGEGADPDDPKSDPEPDNFVNRNPEVGFMLDGQVLASPTCPVEREDQPCPDEGFLTEVDVYDNETDVLIETVSTTGKGEFTTILPTGVYRLLVESESVFPDCPPLIVTVPSASINDITIMCDSGIR